MRIRYVTLTGADDNTPIDEIIELSERYPFVEWGILFSQAKAGVPRYPSLDWVLSLCKCKKFGMNFAAHLCGKWVEDAFNGRITFLEDFDMNLGFDRLQFNCNGGKLDLALNPTCGIWKAIDVYQPVMIGGPWREHHRDWALKLLLNNVSPMFDISGGRGICPEVWPEPFRTSPSTNHVLLCGYAGGLGPDNVVCELDKIEKVVGDNEIWIDMETKLRDKKDRFNLKKCEEVLEAVQKNWMT